MNIAVRRRVTVDMKRGLMGQIEDKLKEALAEVEDLGQKVKDKLGADRQPRDNPETESGQSLQPGPP